MWNSAPLPERRDHDSDTNGQVGPFRVYGVHAMDLIFRFLYAAYGKGTHHKLALDGLSALAGPDAEGWRRLFLSRAEKFVAGSKAPDDQFKDFTNHVLHPRDGYWGGAPHAAAETYGKLTSALKSSDWDEAAWQAGILSHYVVDPLMPFHTGQSEAENNIHRAAEWSINRAYDSLRAEALQRGSAPVVPIAAGPDWLGDLMRSGAARSNADYERLLAHYDITRGVVDPPSGLDKLARRVVSELLLQASATFALVLDRACIESGTRPPEVSLLLPAIIAGLKIPKSMWLKKIADAEDRRIVEAMYDELMATGKVEKCLPADDRMVKERHAAEVLGANVAKTAPTAVASTDVVSHPIVAANPTVNPPLSPPTSVDQAQRPAVSATLASVFSLAPNGEPRVSLMSPVVATEALKPLADAAPSYAEASHEQHSVPAPDARKPVRSRLAPTDDLEAAPSIGPKMAERFATIGIRTVGDFLAGDPGAMEEGLDYRGIDAKTLSEWQKQARLVIDIPGLNGTQARLLTGAGYFTARSVAAADPVALCAAVLKYAASGQGRQILRDNAPPESEKIAGWVATAKAA